MAVEIIPAILENDFSEIKKKIFQVENYVFWVQIDVVDGIFAPNTTWNNPKDLAEVKSFLRFEIDLMIAEPEKHIDEWITSGASRIFFHAEAAKNPEYIINSAREADIEIGMSINPSTPIDVLYDFVPQIDAVLFLGVEPGFQGQVFHDEVIDKIKAMRSKFPELPIEVDGGAKIGIVRKLAQAGATRVIVGNAIFGQGALAIHKNIDDLVHDTHQD